MASVTRTFGQPPVQLRTLGGTVPIAPFIEALGFPALIVPTVNFDNNQHEENENLRLGTFLDSIVTIAADSHATTSGDLLTVTLHLTCGVSRHYARGPVIRTGGAAMRKWILSLASYPAARQQRGLRPERPGHRHAEGSDRRRCRGYRHGKEPGHGLTRIAVTEASGEYRVPRFPRRLRGHHGAAGFSTETRPDIVLMIDQDAIIDFTLKPAAIAETVTVTGESPIVDTTKSDVSTSVSTHQIQDLPVAARRWMDLAMLTPGTSQDNIRGFFYRGNVNIGGGAREYSNGFIVDGVNNTWAEMGEPRQNFAMDAIQEFKVSTSNYKAEYGLATGGLLTVVTKSGTNQFHGSGLLFFRDASDYREERVSCPGTTKPDYHRYQYGGTFGGPIVKNRTHYLLRLRGHEGEPVLHGERRRPVAAVRRHVPEQAEALDLQLQGRSPALEQPEPVLPLGRGGRVPSDHHDRRAHDAERELRLRRAAPVCGAQPHVGDEQPHAERLPLPVRLLEVPGLAAVQPRRLGSLATSRRGCRFCTPVFNYPSIAVGGCGNAQMGPEHR